MALVQMLTTDNSLLTASLTFNNPLQIDQVDFGSNAITFQSCSSYNLVKSDVLLYIQYLMFFNNNLLINFPSIASSVNTALPVSNIQTSVTSLGVKHINYVQTSGTSTVLSINYVPVAGAAGFSARPSAVTITLQEFFMMAYVLSQYANQVNVN